MNTKKITGKHLDPYVVLGLLAGMTLEDRQREEDTFVAFLQKGRPKDWAGSIAVVNAEIGTMTVDDFYNSDLNKLDDGMPEEGSL